VLFRSREGADLDHVFRADRPGEQRHEGSLFGRDLHDRNAAELLGLGDEAG
jgi:hypothetical protein